MLNTQLMSGAFCYLAPHRQWWDLVVYGHRVLVKWDVLVMIFKALDH